MRLDKYLSASGECSRRDCARDVRAGLILIDGKPARAADAEVVPGVSRVVRRGVPVVWREHIYIMLNKPEGQKGRLPGRYRALRRARPCTGISVRQA